MTTMIWPLRRAMQVARERSAVACGDVELTYARDVGPLRRLGGGLRALGLGPGDRVAVVGAELPPLPRALPGRARRGAWCSSRSTSATPPPSSRYALEDSGASVLFAGRRRRRPAARASSTSSTSADGYEALLAGAAPRRVPRRRSASDDARRALLHGRHDGRGQGRDAHPPQPRRQRDALPGCAGRSTPDTRWLIVAAAVPRGRLDRRAGDGLERRPPRRAARVRPRRGARPDRARAGHRDARRADDAGGDRATSSSPARATSRRCALISHGGAPGRHRDAAPRPRRRSPARELLHIYGATETAPIATSLPARGARARRAAGALVRPAGGRRRGRDRRRSTAGRRPAGRGRRGGVRGDNVMAGYWNKPRADRRGARRRLVPHRRPRLHGRPRASSSSSTAPRT